MIMGNTYVVRDVECSKDNAYDPTWIFHMHHINHRLSLQYTCSVNNVSHNVLLPRCCCNIGEIVEKRKKDC